MKTVFLYSSDTDSQQSMNDLKHQNNILRQSKVAGDEIGQNKSAGAEMLGFGEADYEEKLSDLSDGGLSGGTETDGSASADSLSFSDSTKSESLEK